jgi:hypothetical protein
MTKVTCLNKPIGDIAQYAREALEILHLNASLYRQGHPAAYRVVAVQLRLLLCDTNRVHNRLVEISLLPRWIPGLSFHPLVDSTAATGKGLAFDWQKPAIPLAQWLDQTLPLAGGGSIRIKELIRGVCEQDGGAHVDPHPDARLWKMEGREEMIVVIGEYLLESINASVGPESFN